MGLPFIDTLLSLAAGITGVFAAYMVGHGLSTGTAWPWITAGVSALVAGALGALAIRRSRRYARRAGTHPHP